ncbi:MAG: hypothetical protein R2831_09005 [Chitinophagaceae bacterium]
MKSILDLLLPSIISSSVVGLLIGTILKRKTETITAEVKKQFEKNMTVFKSTYLWKEKAISELFGPVNIQLNRTKNAFARYRATNLFLEAKVLKVGNEKIRDLLLEKAYLIPNELIQDAEKLIEHYDVWLEEFDRIRAEENPNLDQKFVYAGPKGFPFPTNSENNFKAYYQKIWNELYGDKAIS